MHHYQSKSSNEIPNNTWELILNENNEVPNSAENSFTPHDFNPTNQMLLENTSNILLCDKQFQNMSVVSTKIMFYSTVCVKETDDASFSFRLCLWEQFVSLGAWFKPNILLEQLGGFFLIIEVQHSKALCLKAIVRAFHSDRTSIPKLLEKQFGREKS